MFRSSIAEWSYQLSCLSAIMAIIYEMDVYPDIAVDLNVLKRKSFVTKLVAVLADFSRRTADGVIALGEDMKARLVARSGSPVCRCTARLPRLDCMR
jgi:hypothetical protein